MKISENLRYSFPIQSNPNISQDGSHSQIWQGYRQIILFSHQSQSQRVHSLQPLWEFNPGQLRRKYYSESEIRDYAPLSLRSPRQSNCQIFKSAISEPINSCFFDNNDYKVTDMKLKLEKINFLQKKDKISTLNHYLRPRQIDHDFKQKNQQKRIQRYHDYELNDKSAINNPEQSIETVVFRDSQENQYEQDTIKSHSFLPTAIQEKQEKVMTYLQQEKKLAVGDKMGSEQKIYLYIWVLLVVGLCCIGIIVI